MCHSRGGMALRPEAHPNARGCRVIHLCCAPCLFLSSQLNLHDFTYSYHRPAWIRRYSQVGIPNSSTVRLNPFIDSLNKLDELDDRPSDWASVNSFGLLAVVAGKQLAMNVELMDVHHPQGWRFSKGVCLYNASCKIASILVEWGVKANFYCRAIHLYWPSSLQIYRRCARTFPSLDLSTHRVKVYGIREMFRI